MTAPSSDLPLPAFVKWPIFPFVGDLQVRAVEPRQEADRPRSGEPGGAPCGACEVNEIVEPGVDGVRLGRRLVHDARVDPTRRRGGEGTVALARGLGVTVIAVGSESEDDRATMRDVGCDYGQGTYFGPVQPAGAVD